MRLKSIPALGGRLTRLDGGRVGGKLMGMERCTVQHRVQAIPTVTIGGEWRWRRKGMGWLLTIISRRLLNITVVGKT